MSRTLVSCFISLIYFVSNSVASTDPFTLLYLLHLYYFTSIHIHLLHSLGLSVLSQTILAACCLYLWGLITAGGNPQRTLTLKASHSSSEALNTTMADIPGGPTGPLYPVCPVLPMTPW